MFDDAKACWLVLLQCFRDLTMGDPVCADLVDQEAFGSSLDFFLLMLL